LLFLDWVLRRTTERSFTNELGDVTPLGGQVTVSAIKLLINNLWIAGESGKTFATIDPALK